MARGQVFSLPNQSANLIETSNKDEANAVAVLNPNDGVVYLKLNGPAGPTPSQWDWKLPSQSYGLFPGPWVSLGLYYLDQSGSGRSGELNVYDSQDKLYTPYIIAIGRAVQAAGTAVDISQGSQPANPPASTIRLWADGAGNLHYLSSTGVDKTILDTSTPLGGDLYGTIPNAHISVQANQNIQMSNSSYLLWTDASITRWNAAQLRLNGSAGVTIQGPLVIEGSSNLSVGGTSTLTGFVTHPAGASFGNVDISLIRTIYGMNNSIYITNNGSVWQMHGAFSADNTLTITGISYLAELHTSGYIYADGGHIYLYTGASQCHISVWNANQTRIYGALMIDGAAPNADLYLAGNGAHLQWNTGYWIGNNSTLITTNGNFQGSSAYYFGGASVNITWNGTYLNFSHSIQFNTPGNQIVWSNGSYISGNAGYVQGSQRALKHSVTPIADSELLAQVSDPRLHVTSYYWEGETKPNTGFIADEIAQVLPKNVVRNKNGEPSGYNPQEMIAILWGAVRELSKKVG